MPFIWTAPEGQALLNRITKLAVDVNFDGPALALKAKSGASGVTQEDLTRAIEIVLARKKAARLGEWAAQGLFTKQSSEQATRPEIAQVHAEHFRGLNHVLEIGTGVGMDCAALAQVAKQVTTLEPDPFVAEMAKHNLQLRGISNVTVVNEGLETFTQRNNLSLFDGIWCDPSRRSRDGQRLHDAEEYQPALSEIKNLAAFGKVGIKLSPTWNSQNYPFDAREVIGFEDECLEQVLWHNEKAPKLKVIIADERIEWSPVGNEMADAWQEETPPYLVELHSALSASGAAEQFLNEHGFLKLNDEFSWGVSVQEPKGSPWYSIFRVSEVVPLDIKKLKKRVSELRWSSRTEIKKRGIDLLPEDLRRDLGLPKPAGQSPHGVIMVSKFRARPVVFLAQRERDRHR